MLIEGKRPRELHWYHAGPMLFGDWGTSRLYVLGLAFYYTRHAALWFMLAMSLLLIAVGWAYQIVCRIYPDGGGVYSSAKQRSHSLAVIGGLLLCADYLVTAAISALDGFHYLNLPRPEIWAVVSIALIGVVNYFGPKKAGTLGLIAALLTIALTLVLGLWTVPSLSHADVERPVGSALHAWAQFTSLILAISGVEAIANMTGIMVEPVEKTAKRSIWPVLGEIVILNLVLTLAMLAIPSDVLGGGNPENAYSLHRDDMLRAIAEYYIGPTFAAVSALVFALLLLSAANTAITGLVSIQFMMARDRELPASFALLNQWGMPLVPLLLATGVPVLVLLAAPDVEQLADLYAIGVVGAVAINLGSCATNWSIKMRSYERAGMGALGLLMIAVWVTVAYEKPHALIFAMSIMAAGLGARYVVKNRAQVRQWMLADVSFPGMVPAQQGVSQTGAIALGPSAKSGPKTAPAPPRPRVMVATRGSLALFRFALDEAKTRDAELYVLFVRHVAIAVLGTPNTPDVEADPAAREFFEFIAEEAKAAGVPVRCLYAVAWDVAEAILDFAATCSVDLLVLGATQRGAMWRAMKGNVIESVAEHLPERIRLLIQA